MKDKEYFKKYIQKLSYKEFLALSQAMIELSTEMQHMFAKGRLDLKNGKKKNGDDSFYG